MTYEPNLSNHRLEDRGPCPVGPAEAALVQTLEGGRAALPVLPDVAARALMVAKDPDASVRRFADLIKEDPPIAARFVALANSALFSRGKPITSVTEAVSRVGLSGARDLIFQVVYASTTSGLTRYQTEVQQSFRRSVLAAVICRIASPMLGLDLHDAYLCGLLHDIGESRVYRILSESRARPSEDEVPELVRKYHARAGAELAMRWALPDELVHVCRAHEEPGRTHDDRLRVVRLADLLVDQVLDPRDLVGALPAEALAELDVSEHHARAILERSLRDATRK